MGLLNDLNHESIWQEFYNYKIEKAHLSKRDEKVLSSFIENKRYQTIVDGIVKDGYQFEYPEKKLINKMNSTKKRVVYSFCEDESIILKLMAYLFNRYDSYLSDRLYSFRKNYGAKKAINMISGTKNIQHMYCYKADITNYFNSINVEKLLVILKEIIADDLELYLFLEKLLMADKAYFEGNLINEKRGVMAGTPISPFLANVYLTKLDREFENLRVPYARYSDDIICFADSLEELKRYQLLINDTLEQHDLILNKEKEMIVLPNEPWDFLGVSYNNKTIDLSKVTIIKMKGKIRRKARAIYRWKIKRNVPDEKAIKVFIKTFNNKFFDNKDVNDLTWTRWFFPLLTVDVGLQEIDAYMQQYLRYLVTGKFNKANYRTEYETLKRYGYRNLVHEYYKFSEKCEQKSCSAIDLNACSKHAEGSKYD